MAGAGRIGVKIAWQGRGRYHLVMPGAGPASTPGGVETTERRGWRPFGRHDGKGQPAALGRYFNAYAAQAGHPRLAVLLSAEGVDGGPEPVPGLVPGSRHDDRSTTARPNQPAVCCKLTS